MNFRGHWRTRYTIRTFWLRVVFYFIMGAVLGFFVYWPLSGIDPASLAEPSIVNRGRDAMIRLTLALGTPAQWGWFWFFLIVISGFVNDWYYFRFQNLPPYSESEGQAKKREEDHPT